jgi:DNA-binding cell septation regulator SpoVG
MDPMEIRVFKKEGDSNVLANATVTIPMEMGDIKISGIQVVKGKNGPFVSLPRQRYDKDGETQYADILELPLRLRREMHTRIFEELQL